jgi:hypothetical protein
MNSLWDIRIFLGLVPKELPVYVVCGPWIYVQYNTEDFIVTPFIVIFVNMNCSPMQNGNLCKEEITQNFRMKSRSQLPGPTFKGQDPDFWPLKMGPIGCPETSVINTYYSLRNSPQ